MIKVLFSLLLCFQFTFSAYAMEVSSSTNCPTESDSDHIFKLEVEKDNSNWFQIAGDYGLGSNWNILKSTNQGRNWVLVDSGKEPQAILAAAEWIDSDIKQNIYVAGYYRKIRTPVQPLIRISSDLGTTWSKIQLENYGKLWSMKQIGNNIYFIGYELININMRRKKADRQLNIWKLSRDKSSLQLVYKLDNAKRDASSTYGLWINTIDGSGQVQVVGCMQKTKDSTHFRFEENISLP